MINKALKLLRGYHNLKQVDLAKRLGVSQSYLSEIEGGEKSVSYELLEKYSSVFGLPVSAIAFFGEMDKTANRDSFPVKLTGKALQVLEWFDNLGKFNSSDGDRDKTPKTV